MALSLLLLAVPLWLPPRAALPLLPSRSTARAVPRATRCQIGPIDESTLPKGKVKAHRSIRGVRRNAGELSQAGRQGKVDAVRNLQKLSITGGFLRTRKLITPDVYMRPMMSRVREALFSLLYPAGILADHAQVLDLFAGSGVIGLESISRGMGKATFVDFSPKCTKVRC